MDIRTLGKPLRSADFRLPRAREHEINRQNEEARAASEQEIRVSVICRRHLSRLLTGSATSFQADRIRAMEGA
ncbi:hypothetical protein TW86_03735 [Halomonas sp. S2151]|nr:hypothetical protein TW86_03735 [Halomonas sp. S2151]